MGRQLDTVAGCLLDQGGAARVDDRRRMALTLTPRGEAAATAGWQAASQADTELASRLSPDGVAALRAGLITLCQMADETDAAAAVS